MFPVHIKGGYSLTRSSHIRKYGIGVLQAMLADVVRGREGGKILLDLPASHSVAGASETTCVSI